MAVYSVHSPGKDAANVMDAAFVKEGFCAAAFFFGPLWLLRRGLWLWTALWFVAFFSLVILASAGIVSSGATFTLLVMLQLLLGLEANRLIEGRLWRRGYDLIEIVAAPTLDQAEMSFYHQFCAPETPVASAAPVRPASAPVVLGSLPEPGARPGTRY